MLILPGEGETGDGDADFLDVYISKEMAPGGT